MRVKRHIHNARTRVQSLDLTQAKTRDSVRVFSTPAAILATLPCARGLQHRDFLRIYALDCQAAFENIRALIDSRTTTRLPCLTDKPNYAKLVNALLSLPHPTDILAHWMISQLEEYKPSCSLEDTYVFLTTLAFVFSSYLNLRADPKGFAKTRCLTDNESQALAAGFEKLKGAFHVNDSACSAEDALRNLFSQSLTCLNHMLTTTLLFEKMLFLAERGLEANGVLALRRIKDARKPNHFLYTPAAVPTLLQPVEFVFNGNYLFALVDTALGKIDQLTFWIKEVFQNSQTQSKPPQNQLDATLDFLDFLLDPFREKGPTHDRRTFAAVSTRFKVTLENVLHACRLVLPFEDDPKFGGKAKELVNDLTMAFEGLDVLNSFVAQHALEAHSEFRLDLWPSAIGRHAMSIQLEKLALCTDPNGRTQLLNLIWSLFFDHTAETDRDIQESIDRLFENTAERGLLQKHKDKFKTDYKRKLLQLLQEMFQIDAPQVKKIKREFFSDVFRKFSLE